MAKLKQAFVLQSDEDLKDDSERIDRAECFEPSLFRSCVYYLIVFLAGGIVVLLSRWYPVAFLRWRCRKSHIDRCRYVLLKHGDGEEYIAEISEGQKMFELEEEESHANVVESTRTFTHRCRRYIYSPDDMAFIKVSFEIQIPYKTIHDEFGKGLKTNRTYESLVERFGSNIIEIPLKSDFGLLIDEVLHPFFVFQLFSIGLWCLENYYIYAVAIFVVSLISAVSGLLQTKSNLLALKTMAEFECQVTVFRYGETSNASSGSLVPGDVLELHDGMKVPCDLILLNGECIMNESSLTG